MYVGRAAAGGTYCIQRVVTPGQVQNDELKTWQVKMHLLHLTDQTSELSRAYLK